MISYPQYKNEVMVIDVVSLCSSPCYGRLGRSACCTCSGRGGLRMEHAEAAFSAVEINRRPGHFDSHRGGFLGQWLEAPPAQTRPAAPLFQHVRSRETGPSLAASVSRALDFHAGTFLVSGFVRARKLQTCGATKLNLCLVRVRSRSRTCSNLPKSDQHVFPSSRFFQVRVSTS